MQVSLPTAGSQVIRFHLSVNVSDLTRSVAFYRVLFNQEPAKVRADYAKFELDDPPVVFSLEPTPRTGTGALNHVGFRVPNSGVLVAMQRRLGEAGIDSKREDGVECCYARQTKFWVYDPDGTMWEVYTLDEDIDHRGPGQVLSRPEPTLVAGQPGESRSSWEHRMNEPVPARAPHDDQSVQEVRLRGTFNLELSAEQRRGILSEAYRVLQPGGRLFVHVLTTDRPHSGNPNLPGPAGAVQHVPREADIVALLEQAGFCAVRLLKFDAKPCFVRDGVPMRETQIECWKPTTEGSEGVQVLYKGPFRQVTDDLGNVYPRGQWTRMDRAAAERLRTPEWASQFLILG